MPGTCIRMFNNGVALLRMAVQKCDCRAVVQFCLFAFEWIWENNWNQSVIFSNECAKSGNSGTSYFLLGHRKYWKISYSKWFIKLLAVHYNHEALQPLIFFWRCASVYSMWYNRIRSVYSFRLQFLIPIKNIICQFKIKSSTPMN